MKAPHISLDNETQVFDAIAKAIDTNDHDYAAGMENIAIAFLYRQKAKERGCAFIDPHYVEGKPEKLSRELAGQPAGTLFTSPVNVYADNTGAPNEAYRQLFKNTVSALLAAEHLPATVIIPIGCQEIGTVPHNILVVLEDFNFRTPKASIIDQMGCEYKGVKQKIINDLCDCGIDNIKFNKHPMSENRMDCATFTSYIADLPLADERMHDFIDACDNYVVRTRNYPISTDMIDQQHREDKEYLVKAGYDLGKDLRQEASAKQSQISLRNLMNKDRRS